MRLRVLLLSLVMIAALPAAGSSSAAPPAPTDIAGQQELCFGQVPTIVGTPGSVYVTPRIEGTEGVDVVVTNGAYGVDLLGGDDLLCITGEPDSVSAEDPPTYFTGDGNDRMDSSTGPEDVYLSLVPGPGTDEVIGGSAPESVFADDTSSAQPDVDLIRTGGGRDVVWVDGGDDVNLGLGRDEVNFSGGGSGGVLNGGGRGNTLYASLRHDDSYWKLDNRGGWISRGGVRVAVMAGFSGFHVRARGALTFVGSDFHESLAFGDHSGAYIPAEGLVVRMGGGDDAVWFHGGAPGGIFKGGDGTDMFRYGRDNGWGLNSRSPIVFNLTSGSLRDIGEKPSNRWAPGFESADLFNTYLKGGLAGTAPMTIKGTSGPNWLSAGGYPSDSLTGTIYGRAGDDVLIGANAGDVLIGGAGQDEAYGHRGLDRCKAEIKFGCEG